MPTFKAWACDVTDSSFRGADLFGAVLDGRLEGRVTKFTRVGFLDADLRKGSAGAWYIDCDFSGARLANTNFDGVTLVRCTFAGPVYKTSFAPRKLYGFITEPGAIVATDFSLVLFWQTVLTGVNFGEIALPADPDLVVIPDAATASRVRSALPKVNDEWPYRWLGIIERSLDGSGGGSLFNLRDEPNNVSTYRRALKASGVTVAVNAGRGLVGRSAGHLRALGMTLDRVPDLRSFLEEDRERDYRLAGRINASQDEIDQIPPRTRPPEPYGTVESPGKNLRP